MRVVGGVLAANGMTEFLANYQEAAAEFDAGHDDLVALFETAVGEPNGPVSFATTPPTGNDLPPDAAGQAWPADRWAALLERAGVGYTTGDPKTAARKAIPAGRWLVGRLRRLVTITASGRPAAAELRQVPGPARSKKYLLLVRFADQDCAPDGPPAEPTPTAPDPPPAAPAGENGEDW